VKSTAAVINRTGVATAPEQAEAAVSAAASAVPSSKGTAHDLDSARMPYLKAHEPIGSRPPGLGKMAPDIFMDKLGERLAFERSGTRLYQLMLGKMQANGRSGGGPSIQDIEHIMQEEYQHFQLVSATIAQLGGDPTLETPCADLTGVASIGLVQIMADPRTTVPQSLHALLTAELTDNDGWEMLIQLAKGLGHDEVAGKFEGALKNEQEHLENVRGWMLEMTQKEAGLSSMWKGRSGQSTKSKS
jgi:bacterioferritin (cytochrome b1)